MTAAPDLARLKKMFSEARDLMADARQRSLVDIKYFHSEQLTREEIAALRRRKQPDIIINRVKPAVLGTLGVIKGGQTDPKAWPRTPKDEDASDVATKVLRFVADENDFDDAKMRCAWDYLVPGTMAAIVEVDADKRVTFTQVRWEEFFYDPRSRREDFDDARYMGVAKWMYADDVKAAYPDKGEAIGAELDGSSPIPTDETFDDRPTFGNGHWVDRRNRRILVVEMYHREGGTWQRCVYFSGGVLAYGPSPFLDAKKRPTCPIVAQSCFVNHDNERYGIVFDMRGPQDEINKRRSKALHLITMRQTRVGLSSSADKEDIRRELAKPDGIVVAERDDFEVLRTDDMAQGNLLLMNEAKAEIERLGPNPAVLGRSAEASSGRAQLVRQQAGFAELAPVFGGIEAWERRVYKAMWERARQYWDAPMYIRVTDDEGAPQFVGINQPQYGEPMVGMDPATGMPAIVRPVMGYENALAEMDVDITLDSVPDTANVQQEQFQTLVELAKLYGPQEVPFDDMLMLSSITDKQKILERRKARAEEAQQSGAPMQELQMRGALAQVAKAEGDAANSQASAILKQAQAQTEIVQPQFQAAELAQRGDLAMLRQATPAAGV